MGDAAIAALDRIQRAVMLLGRKASDGALVTEAVVVNEARDALAEFHASSAPPAAPLDVPDEWDAAALRHYILTRAGIDIAWMRPDPLQAKAAVDKAFDLLRRHLAAFDNQLVEPTLRQETSDFLARLSEDA